ncbi:MAG: protein adenylyltransferase SelO [Candidatus Binatia bacterium]
MSTAALRFDNSYSSLPATFYSRVEPVRVPNPHLIRVNEQLAEHLGIDLEWLRSDAAVRTFAGNDIPAGAEPIATVYAGFQFGAWNPRLGDGRAILLGELIGRDGIRYDVQLKGSGRTPYSRNGDGKAALGPVLREYVVSEAMAALGIPTTRSLAAVTTGEQVYREQAPLPGAVLTRVAQSHIRVGTVQYFASRRDENAIRILLDHVVERHYPEARRAENPYRAMLEGVIARQAELVARWLAVGFIHGVMNTDNMLLSGETIDYGPCAFLDDYDPQKVYSSIDYGGRYAYANQPPIAHWNLTSLAEAMFFLLDEDRERAFDSARAALDEFPGRFLSARRRTMVEKIGLTTHRDGDDRLIDDLLSTMAAARADFTLTFRRLTELADPDQPAEIDSIYELSEALGPWVARWRERIALEGAIAPAERRRRMAAVNPVFLPRNHLVEEVIAAAIARGDFQPFHDLVDLLARPSEWHPEKARYARPPRPEEVVRQTFCGT